MQPFLTSTNWLSKKDRESGQLVLMLKTGILRGMARWSVPSLKKTHPLSHYDSGTAFARKYSCNSSQLPICTWNPNGTPLFWMQFGPSFLEGSRLCISISEKSEKPTFEDFQEFHHQFWTPSRPSPYVYHPSCFASPESNVSAPGYPWNKFTKHS